MSSVVIDIVQLDGLVIVVGIFFFSRRDKRDRWSWPTDRIASSAYLGIRSKKRDGDDNYPVLNHQYLAGICWGRITSHWFGGSG